MSVFKREEVRPLWIKIVAPVTVVYLILELTFNTHLLNMMSTTTGAADISVLEHWGRLLSGFAVALTCWPTIISLCKRGRMPRSRATAIVLGWTILVMGVVFHYEWKLNEHIAGNVKPQQRSQAAMMTLLQGDVIQGNSSLPGYTTVPGQPAAQKAVYALIPFFGLSMTAENFKLLAAERDTMLAKKIRKKLMEPDTLNKINALAAGLANHGVGSPWRRYEMAMHNTKQGRAKAEADAVSWYKFLVQRARYQGMGIPVPATYSKTLVAIASGDGTNGVPVPAGWRGERGPYEAAARKVIEERVTAKWVEQMGDLPFGLTPETFATNPRVISALIQKAGLPQPLKDHPVTLKHFDATDEDYIEHVVVPLGLAQTLETRRSYMGEDKAYADSGRLGTFGRTQARAVTSPVLALAFSTLGALIHLLKGLVYIIQFTTRIAFRKGVYKMAAVAVGILFFVQVLAPFMAGRVCDQPFVAQALSKSTHFLTEWTDSPLMGRSLGALLESSVRLQPILYPLGEHTPISVGMFSYDPAPWAD